MLVRGYFTCDINMQHLPSCGTFLARKRKGWVSETLGGRRDQNWSRCTNEQTYVSASFAKFCKTVLIFISLIMLYKDELSRFSSFLFEIIHE